MIKPTTQHEGSWLTDLPAPTLIPAAEGNMKASKVILYATSALLVLIWMSAFIISYVSLVAVATVGGLTYPWVWLWPLLLDAFMCIGSLDVIRRWNGSTHRLPFHLLKPSSTHRLLQMSIVSSTHRLPWMIR